MPGCNQMLLKEDLKKILNACKCTHHVMLPKTILQNVFDDGEYELIKLIKTPLPKDDPLNFGDKKIL